MTKFAIAGFGHIGRRHAAHILNHPQAQLVAVCDIDDKVRGFLPDTATAFYNNYHTLLQETDADVISVCTPNFLHAAHTVDAIQKGKHVIVEKPMALSVDECDRMIAAAVANGKTIFAVKQNRYNPPVQAVRQLIDSGKLGKVLMIQVNCFWNRSDQYYRQSNWRGKKEQDGGCLFTQFSHFVDILYYLNGGIASATGMMENFLHQHNTEFEDTGALVMRAENGAIINFCFTTCSFEKNMEGSITLFAEKGTLKIGGQYLNTLEYQCIDGVALPQINISAKENDYGLYKGSMSNHDKVIQNVIDVLNGDSEIMTSAAQGREVIRTIELMYSGCKS